jgi:hypothetical protein
VKKTSIYSETTPEIHILSAGRKEKGQRDRIEQHFPALAIESPITSGVAWFPWRFGIR